MHHFPWLILLPFVSSFLIFLFSAFFKEDLKRLSLLLSCLPLIMLGFYGTQWLGAAIDLPWLPSLGINFYLKIDSLSLLFLFLIAVIIPASIYAVKRNEHESSNFFYGLILLLEGLLFVFFTARDLAVFTVFWEAMLIPLFFIINEYGKMRRQEAALKFLTYMIAGSILMIAGVLFLYFFGNETYNLDQLAKVAKGTHFPHWLFAIFLLAFAVKTPLFPFHGWLADAYYEAPAAGTILLSALLSKAGIYGFLRIGFELFENGMKEWSFPLFILALIGVFYGALAAFRQRDFKRLLAYSSFSHVNFILAGIFIWNMTAHTGAIVQAINHGITIAALFLSASWLEDRLGGTSFANAGGLAKILPALCWFTMIFVLSNVALPGTNNFIGELLILFGTFIHNPILASILALAIIFSALYMLRFMQKIYFGSSDVANVFPNSVDDIHWREKLVALSFVFLIFWIGIYPTPILKEAEPAALQKEI